MAEARAAVPRKTRTEGVTPEALTLAATKIVEGIRADPEDGAAWLRRVLGRTAFLKLRQEQQVGEGGVYGQAGQGGGFVSSTNNRMMMIKCKGQGQAQGQAQASAR
jgi:hypothetical protein